MLAKKTALVSTERSSECLKREGTQSLTAERTTQSVAVYPHRRLGATKRIISRSKGDAVSLPKLAGGPALRLHVNMQRALVTGTVGHAAKSCTRVFTKSIPLPLKMYVQETGLHHRRLSAVCLSAKNMPKHENLGGLPPNQPFPTIISVTCIFLVLRDTSNALLDGVKWRKQAELARQ